MVDVLPLDEFGYQICKDCQRRLPLSEFGKNSEHRLGVLKICKKCGADRARAWYVANLDKAFATQLRRKFGITREQYDAMLAEQGGMCAICGAPPAAKRNARRRQGVMITPRLVVDHDHATGKVRGLLCSACNRGIGFLKDDAATVRFALKYLEERS